MDALDNPILYAKGVGPVKAEIFKSEMQVHTFCDLLQCYPFRYIDKRVIHTIDSLYGNNEDVQLKGKFRDLEIVGNGRSTRLEGVFADNTGSIRIVWFKGIKNIKKMLNLNTTYILYGKPTLFMGSLNITHPEIETYDDYSVNAKLRFYPVYHTSEKMKSSGLDSRSMAKIIFEMLERTENDIAENLPRPVMEKYRLVSRATALKNIHYPTTFEELEQSRRRLKYEELFFLQLSILSSKIKIANKHTGFVFPHVGGLFNEFYKKNIPFELTNAQKRVIKEIRNDFRSGKQMNRLLQGDVGSGKTLVALMCMVIAIENGFQVCLMAPTEILAQQHFKTLSKFIAGLPINVACLTGSTKNKEKKIILDNVEQGKVDILVGTHILIEDYVTFKHLGFCVIDEQHRFGVEQRARLWKKNEQTPPHILVMTATPIPRTLAMTLYGDLDYSVIDELPPGRKPVKTLYVPESRRIDLNFFIREQIKKGRQIYMIFPLINESKKLELKDLMDGFERVSREFPLPEYQISIVHGQQKQDVQDIEMQRFINNETQVMVATTVIEVGVDVPNASVMVIENAERFGLSQLHQLRGRIGRGSAQSYCILMTGDKVTMEGRSRIQTMMTSNDGFVIAEADLKLRGPGDINGTRQSGILNLKIADIANDDAIVKASRNDAFELLDIDPDLTKPENTGTKTFLDNYIRKNKKNWSEIS